MDVPNLDFLIYDIGTMIVPASQGHGERQIERRMEVSAWEATPPFPGPCLKPPSERSPGGVIAMQAFSLSLIFSKPPALGCVTWHPGHTYLKLSLCSAVRVALPQTAHSS